MKYQPPHTLTPTVVNLVARIGEAVGRLSALSDSARDLRLRRLNRIRTVQGSLAIEGNTLSQEQITAILEGKRVVAPPREILEAQNAFAAYDRLARWRPEVEADLLEAHRVLMSGLIPEAGAYRTGGVGVVSGGRVIHMAPPAKRVAALIRDLLGWLGSSAEHPLVVSSVFHYEFEFIHPFSDGNGRMGRLWQSLILSQWNPLFADVPIESLVYERQQDYYRALRESTSRTDSAPFIEFMLERIFEAVQVATPQVIPQVTPQVRRLVEALQDEMSRDELQRALGLSDRKSFRDLYLNPALEAGLIEMTLADKPNSRLQKYRLSARGARLRGGSAV